LNLKPILDEVFLSMYHADYGAVKAICDQAELFDEQTVIDDFFYEVFDYFAEIYYLEECTEAQIKIVKLLYGYEPFRACLFGHLQWYHERNELDLDQISWWRNALGCLWRCHSCMVGMICTNLCDDFDEVDLTTALKENTTND
jgi:hypothetical protein